VRRRSCECTVSVVGPATTTYLSSIETVRMQGLSGETGRTRAGALKRGVAQQSQSVAMCRLDRSIHTRHGGGLCLVLCKSWCLSRCLQLALALGACADPQFPLTHSTHRLLLLALHKHPNTHPSQTQLNSFLTLLHTSSPKPPSCVRLYVSPSASSPARGASLPRDLHSGTTQDCKQDS
jgi:hypothetical protein